MRNNTPVHWAVVVLASAGLHGAGCSQQRPPAPVAPPVRVAVGHTLGSPVPLAPPGGAGGEALVVTVTGYAADPATLPPGEPLAARARLVVDSAGQPVATAPAAAERVTLLADVSALRTPTSTGKGASTIQVVRSPLPPGCTVLLSFSAAVGRAGAGDDAGVRLAIVSPTAAGSDRPGLLVTARQSAEDPAASEAAPVSRDRTVLLDWPSATLDGEFALVFPPAPGARLPVATVFRVRVEGAAGDPEAAQASARIAEELSEQGRAAGASLGNSLASAITSSAPPGLRRALAGVCAELHADVTFEASLLAEDKDLPALVSPVAQALAAAPADAETGQLAWLADRATLEALAKPAGGGEASAPLRAMLSARFGEVGRDAGAVSELAAASPSRADFDARVRAENVILLDDASPAARVRAFEWTSRQDPKGTLKGYEPMGPAPQRRQAIENYLQSLSPATQPASTAPGGSHE